ncbi:SNF2 family N-terminal domain-containing protein [Hypoxylon trugodes]|uniref:SNF2 family N-terminal domain-containing protein n=1 Tax=Hypoxylon trugodes TaxID=326681 RepID=UPI0021984AD7|nr:SNF2 family N-terminal domain-containing protein [Hypoxylon trugodes]KAI1383675.1 SNF2 family N-terminal domain-containing protein [Hypoxylon trugodes]
MDINDLLWNSQSTGGSKRPGSAQAPEDREAKRSRTQPYNNTGDETLYNELSLPFYEDSSSPLQDSYHSHWNRFNNVCENQINNFASGGIANILYNPIETGQQIQPYITNPVSCAYGEQPNFDAGMFRPLDQSSLGLPFVAETWPRDSPSQPFPINSFPPPSPQFDTSMGNTINNGILSACENPEAPLPVMGLGGLGDSQETLPQRYTTTPDVCSNEQSVLSEPQPNEAEPQSPVTSLSTESMDIDNDYDTCFGVILATPTSSFSQRDGAHSVPVVLKPFGNILMLCSRNSDEHAGILGNFKFVNAVRQLRLRLDATLFISRTKDTGGISKPKMRKKVPAETTREYSIRIVIHGLQADKEIAGNLLSDAGCFLQHPCTTEVISGVQYDNPHYLLRPGAEMPKLEHLLPDIMDDDPIQAEVGSEISRSRFQQIFENAEADGGALTTTSISPSPRLRSPLMRHQLIALAMMHEKESGYIEEPMFPSLWEKEIVKSSGTTYYRHTATMLREPKPIPARGGILADDMGLGKTLSVLALICSSLDLRSTAADQGQNTEYQGTLIITPTSSEFDAGMHAIYKRLTIRKAICGWMDQASEHIHQGQLRMEIYHGPGRERLSSQFRDIDVVITTYETLRSEWEASEAHHIRNRSRKTFRSVCELVSCYRWCLTGTPIHNSLDDYGALLSFIRVFPFMQKSEFTSLIVQPVEQGLPLSIDRLQALIRATCLRRTKRKTLELPPRSERVHEVHLHADDQDLYDIYKKLCVEKAADKGKRLGVTLSHQGKDCNILSLITCLQRICDHGEHLLPDSMKRIRKESSSSFLDEGLGQIFSGRCSVCEGEIDGSSSGTKDYHSICVNCRSSEGGSSESNRGATLSSELGVADCQSASFERSNSAQAYYRPSAKVLALLENLKREQGDNNPRPRKSVVFSSWVKMLDLVEQALQQQQIGFERIDGSTSLEGRRKALGEFNNNVNCTVMLATIGSAAEGVNLTAACVVHLLEPHWNPMVEAQAVDRVHRIGQTQEVTIIRYVVPNSVETYVQKVQDDKLQIINQTINTNGITETDLELRRWERMKEMLA